MIESIYRVRCDGPCKRWLRKGRPVPVHWGPGYAEVFLTLEDARQALEDAGWTGGRCRADQSEEGR